MLSPRVRQLHSLSSHTDFPPLLSSLYHIPSSHLLSIPSISPIPSPMSSDIPLSTPDPSPVPDPSSVDFRTFYPYTPNEVKHRKRTSRAQLKVLEDHFRRDTKPNAGLRKVLADQLGMSVRGVQVWFQNRRAKEKALASKALARKAKSLPSLAGSSPATDGEHHGSPLSPGMLELIPESPSNDSPQSNRSTSNPPEFADTSSESSPIATNPPHFGSDPCPTPWQNSPSHEDTVFIVRPGDAEPYDSHIVNLRRGSLPVYPPPSDYSLSDDFGAIGRRRSVDNSLLRLASHPYAHLARAKNGALFGSSYAPPTHASHTDPSFHHHLGRALAYSPHSTRPRIPHSLSVPHDLTHIHAHHRASLDASMYDFANPSSLTPFHATRATFPENHMHVMSSRTISSPLPGPLPSPDFSFGVAPSPPPQIHSPIDPGRDSPDLNAFAFQRRPDDPDTEDDATSGSYDAYSRFGSMVSLAGSESSNTSAYYSDVGSCVAAAAAVDAGYNTSDVRRGSSPNGRFLNMMSGLDVNGQQSGLADSHASATVHGHGSYSPRETLVSSTNTPISSEMLRRDSGNSDGQTTTTYPSPSSTVSPGQTPLVEQTRAASCFPISRSSELAFALHGSGSQDPPLQTVNGVGATRMATESSVVNNLDPAAAAAAAAAPSQHHPLPFFYVSSDSGPMYAPAESSIKGGSSLSLPLIDFATDKYSFDGDMPQISSNGHYHTTISSTSSSSSSSASTSSYTSPIANDGQQYNPDESFTDKNQNRREALHGIEFAYTNNHTHQGTVDPSSLENTHNNNNNHGRLHTDTYNAYA